MKNILYMFFLSCLLFGCASSDKDYEEIQSGMQLDHEKTYILYSSECADFDGVEKEASFINIYTNSNNNNYTQLNMCRTQGKEFILLKVENSTRQLNNFNYGRECDSNSINTTLKNIPPYNLKNKKINYLGHFKYEIKDRDYHIKHTPLQSITVEKDKEFYDSKDFYKVTNTLVPIVSLGMSLIKDSKSAESKAVHDYLNKKIYNTSSYRGETCFKNGQLIAPEAMEDLFLQSKTPVTFECLPSGLNNEYTLNIIDDFNEAKDIINKNFTQIPQIQIENISKNMNVHNRNSDIYTPYCSDS